MSNFASSFKITNIEIKDEKEGGDGREFKVLRGFYRPEVKVETSEGFEWIKGQKRPVTLVVANRDHSIIGGRENINYDDYVVGMRVMGRPVTRKVQPYDITDTTTGEIRTTNTYTTFVQGDDTDEVSWNIAVQKAFKAAKHPIVNATPEAAKEEAASDLPY